MRKITYNFTNNFSLWWLCWKSSFITIPTFWSVQLRIFVKKPKCQRKEYSIILSYSRKNPKKGVKDIPFWKKPLEVLDLLLYPKKFWRKQAFTPVNYPKVCDTPWKLQDQKSRPMGIPHEFLLNTLRNSTSFLIEPSSICSFFITPGNSMSPTTHGWIFSGIAPNHFCTKQNIFTCKSNHLKYTPSTAQNPYQKIEKDISISTVIVVSHFMKLNSIVKRNIDNLLFLASVS